MKFCKECGGELIDEARFCPACGTKVDEDAAAPIPAAEAEDKPEAEAGAGAQNIPGAKFEPETAEQEVEAQPEPKAATEKSKKKKIVLLIVLAGVVSVLLFAGVIAGALFVLRYISAEQRTLRALAADDYAVALEIIEEDESVAECESVAEALVGRIGEIKEEYDAELLGYEAALSELDIIDELDVVGVDAEADSAAEYISERQAISCLAEGDYYSAMYIIEENGSVGKSEALAAQLKSRLESIKAEYADGTMDYEDAASELSYIAMLGIGGIASDLENVSAFVGRVEESRWNFYMAEDCFASGDYVGAMEYYKQVSEEDSNYVSAQTGLENAVSCYREDILARAAEYADQELYTESIGVLEEGLTVLPGDESFTGQIGVYEAAYNEKLINDALAEAAALAADGDVLGALRFIESSIEEYGEHVAFEAPYSEFSAQYEEKVIGEAEKAFAEKDFESALSILSDGLAELPESAAIAEALEKTEKSIPTGLPETEELAVGGGDAALLIWNKGKPGDLSGSDYSKVINYAIVSEEGTTAIAYAVNGKFKTLSGVLAPHTTMTKNGIAIVEIFSGEELIYTSPEIGAKTKAFEFTADIAGAKNLRVVVTAGEKSGVILSDILLWP